MHTPVILADNELGFYFETNDVIAPAPVGVFLAELERIARLKRHFGPDAEVRVIELGVGSLWGKIAVGLGALGGAASIATLGLDISDRLTQPRGRLAEAVATMSIDSSVVSATIVTKDKTVTITSNEMPAITTVEQKRKSGDRAPVDTRFMSGFSQTLIPDHAKEVPAGREPLGRKDFSNLGDKRGARNYLGEFIESDAVDYEVFRLEGGGTFAAKISNEYPLPLVYHARVMVRAELDNADQLMFVHEIYPLEPT
ncbi:hypothetical protein LZ496_09925 [Sphingomonas sp. NSE70-1]|uniref:Uncharacterized protein n=1 Tax=Sphingomonas caseinilyticus TaxID=2908205 RepID=A0ABT0RVN3_9SPHN|nr:hypothetical protein [Sphingomonas caseinilyticus]MCL6699095.1 hypothetical protein [Sphingomonas caseinilyticus]